MGSYGAGLYQSDDSCDLKNSIALLSKTPMDGDRILSILLDQYGDNNDLKDDGVPSFWMVLADQFSKKGIESKIVFKRAIEAMDLGWDLEDQKRRGASNNYLNARLKTHLKLRETINNPKAPENRKYSKSPPKQIMNTGDVFIFPTQQGFGHLNWDISNNGEFIPDGWGALIILSNGRVYDWFPWATCSSLVVPYDGKPNLCHIKSSRLLHGSYQPVSIFIPKTSDINKLKAEKIGNLKLNPSYVTQKVTMPVITPKQAATLGRGISQQTICHINGGVIAIQELLAEHQHTG